jgi:hypothetical protein
MTSCRVLRAGTSCSPTAPARSPAVSDRFNATCTPTGNSLLTVISSGESDAARL